MNMLGPPKTLACSQPASSPCRNMYSMWCALYICENTACHDCCSTNNHLLQHQTWEVHADQQTMLASDRYGPHACEMKLQRRTIWCTRLSNSSAVCCDTGNLVSTLRLHCIAVESIPAFSSLPNVSNGTLPVPCRFSLQLLLTLI